MKRPSVSFILSLSGIGLLGFGGYVAYRTAQSAPEGVRLQKGFVGALFHRERKEKPDTPADRLRRKMLQRETMQRLLAEFPLLQIEERPVPDEENGFLQIQRLGKPPGSYRTEPGMLDELSDCINSWSPEKARAFLAKYPDFIAEAERIAALPGRSSTLSREDYTGFISARPAKSLHDVFLLRARLAAESGNEAAALEDFLHTLQIHSHLRDVEAPSLLVETVVILMDLNRVKWAIDFVLPTLTSTADLNVWREMLQGETNVPARLATVVRGEWHTTADHMFLPCLFMDHHDGNLEDPEETAQVWTADTARWIGELESKPMIGFRSLVPTDQLVRANSLSKEGQSYIDMMLGSATSSWTTGVLRAVVVAAQHRAVMDVLIHERDGQPVPEILDPVSGLPFRFDPSTRTIHAPEWDGAPDNSPPAALPW